MPVLLNTEKCFAPFAILVSLVAYASPSAFAWMKPHIPLLLGAIMLGMGTTLEVSDFKRVFSQPLYLLGGILAQYGAMPLLGLIIAYILGLNAPLTAGIVLLGACPGGTASNVMAYLSKADVGLSVSLTLASTLLAPLLPPRQSQKKPPRGARYDNPGRSPGKKYNKTTQSAVSAK